MKSIRLLLLFGTIATLVGRTDAAAAGAVTRRGPDLLQFTTRNRIGGNEFGPNTAGTLQMQYTERGQTVRQSLQLNASGLESNSVVSITAAMGDSADVITAAHVPTDRRGRIRATYLTRVPAPNGISRIEPVPELLSPLTDVRAICVENSSGVVIGAGSIADADTFQYVVRRNLTPVDPNGTAAGSITLVANQRRVNFTLLPVAWSRRSIIFWS
jgi:hypothetical protein